MDTKLLAHNIRKHCVEMTHLANSSHIGSMLSIADILAVLYGEVLKYDPKNPKRENRDRLILSKGHAGAAMYAVLAECGFFSVEELNTYCQNGSRLLGHISHHIPGVEVSTGSLGHGLSIAAGLAYAAKLDSKKHRVYVIMSDGECDEGSNWEAILFAGHHKLSNLIAIVDYNKIQSLALVKETLDLEPFYKKWEAFNWNVIEVDGHSHNELKTTLNINPEDHNKPTCIIAHTVKGKGISFMENKVLWHYRSPQGSEYENALKELGDYPDEN